MLALFLALLLAGLPGKAQAQPSEELSTVADCVAAGSLKLSERSSLPVQVKSRRVDTEQGPRAVSLEAGQRLLLNTEQGEPFLNLKIERSREGSFEADREAISAQLQALQSKSPATAPLVIEPAAGQPPLLIGLNNPTLDLPIISFYTLFEPTRRLIATAYFLNQKPTRRAFANMQSYAVLRDRALRELRACLGAGAAVGGDS